MTDSNSSNNKRERPVMVVDLESGGGNRNGFELDSVQLAELKKKLNATDNPSHPHGSTTNRASEVASTTHDSARCIFKVPQTFMDAQSQGKHYKPEIVAIGVYNGLPLIPQKHAYLAQLLHRTGLTIETLLESLAPLESAVRDRYSDPLPVSYRDNPHRMVESMAVSGCFLLELFRKFAGVVEFDPDDPVASTTWMLPVLVRDVLRLENQVPFFVLKKLFQLTNNPNNTGNNVKGGFDFDFDSPLPSPSPSMAAAASLSDLCFNFFSCVVAFDRPKWVVKRMRDYEPDHLLDLLRTSFILPLEEKQLKQSKRSSTRPRLRHMRRSPLLIRCSASSLRQSSRNSGGRDLVAVRNDDIMKMKNERDGIGPARSLLPVIPSILELQRAGIKIRTPSYTAETFLDVRYKRGVIQMPTITTDEIMTCFLANCVVYEFSKKNSSTHFISYTTLLDRLVSTSKDVDYLCRANVIKNYLGSEAEVATYLNNLGKNVAIDFEDCHMGELFRGVRSYYERRWNRQWTSFINTYFKTPWSFISAVAALVLLVFTLVQTVYTVLPYYKQ